MAKTVITISVDINAPIEKVWNYFISPEHIKNWNTASPDWHTTKAENDFIVGGKFSYRMEAKDGSFGFDFWGIYNQIIEHQLIEETLGDDRKVTVKFSTKDSITNIQESFEAEDQNPIEMQQLGWQAILNNLKSYIEQH